MTRKGRSFQLNIKVTKDAVKERQLSNFIRVLKKRRVLLGTNGAKVQVKVSSGQSVWSKETGECAAQGKHRTCKCQLFSTKQICVQSNCKQYLQANRNKLSVTFWNRLESSGSFWIILKHHRIFWNILEHFGKFLNILELSGAFQNLLDHSGSF